MATCTGQEALLLWCKLNTTGYQDVKVQNFHSSWKDGLALCALIHKFHPEILQFESLNKDKPLDNLEVAFSSASKLGIPRLLDPDDMMIEPRPDQRSVTTYLSQMYHVFERNDHPGKGIAGVTMAASLNTSENSTEFENSLIQDQVVAKPKLQRSVSTSMLPKHIPGSSNNLSLQKRTGPPLLTKGSIPKFTPPSKTAAPTSPTSPTSPAPTPVLVSATSPTPAPPSPSPSPSPKSPEPLPRSATSSPSPSNPMNIPRKSVSSSAIDIPSSLSSSSGANSGSHKLSSAPVISSSAPVVSAPISFPRSITSPNISMATLLGNLTQKTATDSKTDESIGAPRIINSTRSPSSGASPTHSPSPSPTPPSPSPSPSPTPQDNKKVTKLGTKSAPSHTLPTIKDESDEEKVVPKTPSSTLGSHSTEALRKLKRTVSASGQNWVSKIKDKKDFILIDTVEIKKVKELEGPLQEEDEEPAKPQYPPPTTSKRFLVDKVSSSSREGWLAKVKSPHQEEEEDEYEYVDNDPNRIHEPPSPDSTFKLEPCLLRSSSSGKHQLAMPPLPRVGSLKKVSFKEGYAPSVESIPEEAKMVVVEVQEIRTKDKDVHAKDKELKDVQKDTQKDAQEAQKDISEKSTTQAKNTPVTKDTELKNSKETPTKAPLSPTLSVEEKEAKKLPNMHSPVLSSNTSPTSTSTPSSTTSTSTNVPVPGPPPVVIKDLERERDAAIFHRDEIAARYAELEVKLKEERAANDAMERETADLHQKLASVQEAAEAKFAQKLADMTQKLADKDREILRLRMQNTMNKKKVEEKERDLERLKSSRSFSPPPLEMAEDLEADNECRKTWENVEKEMPKPVVNSYGGIKVSYESKAISESPRSSTASPRLDNSKNYRVPDTPESPFSPDFSRRNIPQKVGMSPMSPTSSSISVSPMSSSVSISPMSPMSPTRAANDSPELHIEVAKVTYSYIRPHTPTKTGDTKLGAQNPSSRPQTPTKIEIKAKPDFKRQDSLSRITVHIPCPKSPEPVKVVLSPKPPARSESKTIAITKSVPLPFPSENSKSGPESSSPPSVLGNTTPREREAPGTPRTFTEISPTGLDLKPPTSKLDDPLPVKTEYRAGTLRAEASKPKIAFSPPSSPMASPRPSPAPSPNPNGTSNSAKATSSVAKQTFHVRHNSNPHSPSPSPSPNPTSPRSNSNPSPSSSPSPGASSSSNSNSNSNLTPKYDSRGSTIPSAKFEQKPEQHTSKTSTFLSFLTRARSNTLPTEPTPSPGKASDKSENNPMNVLSPRGGLKVEVGQAKESADQDDASGREGPQRIARSYSLSALMPPKLTSTPTYIPTGKQAEIKPAWLVNLTKKHKPEEVNSI